MILELSGTETEGCLRRQPSVSVPLSSRIIARPTAEACTAGLAKEYQLSKKNKEGTYDLVSFFNSLKGYVENHGLDSVFYVQVGLNYMDLIHDSIQDSEMTAHVQSFTGMYEMSEENPSQYSYMKCTIHRMNQPGK